MSEISERYARLSSAFAAKAAAVPPDRWASLSPCPEWTARDVVRHAVKSQGMLLGFVGREAGDIPAVDDDPAAAFDAARAVVQADLDIASHHRATFPTFADADGLLDRLLDTLARGLGAVGVGG